MARKRPKERPNGTLNHTKSLNNPLPTASPIDAINQTVFAEQNLKLYKESIVRKVEGVQFTPTSKTYLCSPKRGQNIGQGS